MGNGFSIAWRVYDAKEFVPQRRKRIFLVADFASRCAGKILFESESVCRDFAQSEEAWENASRFVDVCVGNTGETGRLLNGICYDAFQFNGYRESDVSGTITAGMAKGRGDTGLIVFAPSGFAEYKETDECSTLRATKGADLGGGSEAIVANIDNYSVRRLTPTECARLQGFPDWWTDGVEGSDFAKYKMWGNGVCLSCVCDVIGRIVKEEALENIVEESENTGA